MEIRHRDGHIFWRMLEHELELGREEYNAAHRAYLEGRRWHGLLVMEWAEIWENEERHEYEQWTDITNEVTE